jgi:3-oxoacyl-[acyl-carrier-protein] synthase II
MTFLGEQGAGAAALKEAASAIRAGELELALAGASFDGDEYQARFGLAGAGCLSADRDETDLRAVEAWGVAADGTVAGAAAAFLVLESFEHARRREAQLRAELATVSVESGPRRAGSIAASLTRQYEAARGRAAPVSAIVGNGAGITGLDAEERTFLRHVAAARPDSYLTTPSPGIGEVVHASLPIRVVLAVAALERQQLFGVPPLDQARLAPPEMRLLTETLSAPLGAIAAVSIGPFEAESLALVQHAPAAQWGP